MIGHVAFFVAVALGLVRISWGIRTGRLTSIALTTLAVLIFIGCLVIPAHLQASGLIESKLWKIGFVQPPTSSEVDQLAFHWAFELALLIIAECVVTFLATHRRTSSMASPVLDFANPTGAWRNARVVAVALIFIGLCAYVVFPPPTLDIRATSGQGLGTVLRGVLISGLSLLAYFRWFANRRYLFLLIGGTVFLAAANVRSPLVVLFLAFVAGEINHHGFRSKRRVVGVLAAVLMLAMVGSVASSLRANTTRHYGYTTGQVVEQTLRNPLTAPYEAGIDTLDGYRLSALVLPYEKAQPETLLSAFTTFVPRAIWPGKPGSLSVDISSRYLGYHSSGQFLSPVGYLSLALGSYSLGLVGLFVFGLLMALALWRATGSPWLIFVLVIGFRVLMGGDAFDVYYGLTLALPVLFVREAINFQTNKYRLRPCGVRCGYIVQSGEM